MLKVAVTGASGFIGRHTLAELAKHPVAVTAVTRNGSALEKNHPTGKITVVEIDIAESNSDTYRELGSPDVLIHLAWGGLPNYGSDHHTESELPLQYKFLNDLVESGLPALFVSGTCFEYGMQSGPLSEDLPAAPANPYGRAKNTLREQLENLKDKHPFVLTWIRLFYLYGEGQSESSLLPQLERAVELGDEKFGMSGGEQLRDYLPVLEVASMIVNVALRREDIGILNICSGTPITIRNLVEGWISENNWSIDLDFGRYPYSDHEPMAFWGDASKLSSLLSDGSKVTEN